MRRANRVEKRFTVMSVPGRYDDGRDTTWYVLDLWTRKSLPCHDFNAARAACRAANARRTGER